MRKLDINFLAAVIVVSFVMCFIAVLHYTSFERHHTHDWPSNQTQTQQITPNQNYVTNEAPITGTNGVKPLSPAKPRQSTGAYSGNNSLQHYDHKAQIIMAFGTLFGLVVALSGLYLIGKTLRATKVGTTAMQGALIEAKDATKAAWKAASAAQRTLENDRAWVCILDTPHSVVDRFTASYGNGRTEHYTNAITFKIRVKNIGKTPARNVLCEIENRILPVDANIPAFKTDITPNDRKTFLPQGSVHHNGRVDIFGKHAERLWNKTHVAYIFIRCEYQTIFDDKIRYTRELFKFHPEGSTTVDEEAVAQFHISQVGSQNCNT